MVTAGEESVDCSTPQPFREDRNLELWVLLDRTRTAMSRARAKELLPYDLPPRQATILYLVNLLASRSTPTEMATWLFRTQHAIYELATRMEKKGLIEKISARRRRDGVHYVLTDVGREIHAVASQRVTINLVMDTLSPEERIALGHCLDKLRTRALGLLDETDVEPGAPVPLED